MIIDIFIIHFNLVKCNEAKLDGGDVLWTGREILVGLSNRTNQKGLEAVQEAFPGYPVTGIEVSGPLHLKTLLTLCGKDTLCASIESGHSYKMLEVIIYANTVLPTFDY